MKSLMRPVFPERNNENPEVVRSLHDCYVVMTVNKLFSLPTDSSVGCGDDIIYDHPYAELMLPHREKI